MQGNFLAPTPMFAAVILLSIFRALLLVTAILLLWWLVFLCLPALMGGPPFVGSSPDSLKSVMALAGLKAGERVIDLGSGDGRLLIAAAQAGCTVIGYEANLFLVWYSRYRLWHLGFGRQATVHWANFWKADLTGADTVLIYGFSGIMERVARKAAEELKPGGRLVSARFELPMWWPPERRDGQVFLYRKAAVAS